MSDTFEFDAKWQALRERFRDRLGIRLTLIRDSWQAVLDGQDVSGAARSTLFHQVHSLCGSGATFGYDDISEVARQLEQILDPDLDLAVASPPRRDEVVALMNTLGERVRDVNPNA